MSKLLIVHCLFAVATSTKWEFPQMDVNKAFLHSGLDEEVYMLPPPGYDKCRPDDCCRLRKSIYELQQASRNWFGKLSGALKQHGFV